MSERPRDGGEYVGILYQRGGAGDSVVPTSKLRETEAELEQAVEVIRAEHRLKAAYTRSPCICEYCDPERK